MTENLPPKYMGYIILIVLILAVGVGFIFILERSDQAKRMLLDVLFWIPGMSKILSVLGMA